MAVERGPVQGASNQSTESNCSDPDLDSVKLMQHGSNASITHIGLFRMIELCLELFMTKLGHRRTLYSCCPLLFREPSLAMRGIL